MRTDKCVNAYVIKYNANVQEYGETVAVSMANAAWTACRKALYCED